MTVEVVVLNGGSSSGKSSIARRLQSLLGPTWLVLGVDDLVRALPGGDLVEDRIGTLPSGDTPPESPFSVAFGQDGSVTIDEHFRRAEAAWYQGLAAIGRTGTGLLIDEVFLGGGASQTRLAAALSDLEIMWVGVRCDPEIAAARERSRADRVPGMARLQAQTVHEGVRYDLVVDTTRDRPETCAGTIVERLIALNR